MQATKSKSLLGVIVISAMMAVGVLIDAPKPINTRTNELQCVIAHTSAEPEFRDTKASQIAAYHMRSKSKGGRGWSKPGYHDVIELNGDVVNLIPYNEDTIVQYSEIANGAIGYNRIARHVCYIGGMNKEYTKAKNTLTPAQDSALAAYLFAFLELHPNAWIIGHNQIAPKACPSFDVPNWLREHGFPERNIYKKPKLNKQNEKIYNTIISTVDADI